MRFPRLPITQDPLPFNPCDLVPIISPATVLAHFEGHHAAYVRNFNSLLQENGSPDLLRFNYQGHKLHALYWETLIPGGQDYPGGFLMQQAIKQWGAEGPDLLVETLFKKASSLKGSGWVLLVAHARTGKLSIQSIKDHDVSNLSKYVPLVIIDCWEHAYYLDYAFDKKKFFTDFMSLINWDVAEARFASI